MRPFLAAALAVCLSCSTPLPPPPAIATEDEVPSTVPDTSAGEPAVAKKTRATTVTASTASFLRAGHHVDVVSTLEDPQTKEMVAVTLLQNVIVVAVQPTEDFEHARVTLAVIPEEAELLAVSQKLGGLTLSVRDENDLDVLEERGRATANTVLSGERGRLLQQKRFNTIQIIRGSSVSTVASSVRTDAPPPGAVATANVSGMYLKHYGVNPTVETAAEPVSTFSVDVDTASYALARGWLERGELPHQDAIRVEEFVNAFDYGYRSPESEPIAVQVEAFPSPTRPGYHLMHVGVQGKRLEVGERKPAHLVFTLDVSGSMNDANRLGLAKQALALLVNRLEEKDSVAVVVYGDTARVVLPPTNATQRARILEAIAGVQSEGSTNVQAGLELAYSLAARDFRPGHIHRIVLCSDGVANNGITDADGIFARVKDQAGKGITLSTVGFGMGNYNDVLMERLADQGDGNYAYVDTLAAARKIFEEQIDGTLQLVAKDVKLQLAFDPAVVERYRLIGFENRALAKKDFANDAVDAGDLGAGHAVTALYEVKLKNRSASTLATFRARYKQPDGKTSGLVERALPMSVVQDHFPDASGAARLSVVVAGFAEKLRGSYWARTLSWDQLQAMYEALPPAVRERKDAAELRTLIASAKALSRRQGAELTTTVRR